VNEANLGGSDDAPGAIDQATGAMRAATSTAQEKGRELKATATEHSEHLAEEAKAQAQQVVLDARDQLRQQMQTQSDKMRGGLSQLRDQIDALSNGRVEQAGPLPGYLGSVVGQLDSWGDTIDRRGIEGLWHDAEVFARRRPGMFLFGAGIAGFVVGRALRAGAAQTQPSMPMTRSSSTEETTNVPMNHELVVPAEGDTQTIAAQRSETGGLRSA